MANPIRNVLISTGYVVEQRSEFCFAVLMPNPDAGKTNTSYSGRYLTMCVTDGRQEATKIALALNELERTTEAPASKAAGF